MSSNQLEVKETKVGGLALGDIVTQQLWKSDELAKVANITFPVTALDALPPMHKPSISVITVDPSPASKDTYPTSGGQQGLSKHVILKMLNAAGASCRTEKLSPDSDLNFIRWAAFVWGRLPDGTFHQTQGSKAWSWEKCQETMNEKQAKQYREFADEQTETKALLRAARAYMNIKTSYSREELAKPFLVARSVPDLDLSDPTIKHMVAQRLVDSTFALYGQGESAPTLPPPSMPALPSEPTEDEYDDEPDGGTFFGGRSTTPEESAPIEAEAVPVWEYDPFAEGPMDEYKREARRKELLTALKARCKDLQVAPEAMAVMVNEIHGSAVPVPALSLEEVEALATKLEVK